MNEPKRGRGRPKGSKNQRPANPVVGVVAPATVVDCSISPVTTTRASLEADRDRILQSIADSSGTPCPACTRGGDPKVEAALQSQLNGINRMLLRISGETAPADANLVKSPQWSRLKAKLFDCLSKKHPKAWADLLQMEAEG